MSLGPCLLEKPVDVVQISRVPFKKTRINVDPPSEPELRGNPPKSWPFTTPMVMTNHSSGGPAHIWWRHQPERREKESSSLSFALMQKTQSCVVKHLRAFSSPAISGRIEDQLQSLNASSAKILTSGKLLMLLFCLASSLALKKKYWPTSRTHPYFIESQFMFGLAWWCFTILQVI